MRMGGAQRALISAFYVRKTRHLRSGASSPSPAANGTNPRRNDSTANRRSTTQLLEAELKQRFTLLYHDRTTAVNCTNLRALKKNKLQAASKFPPPLRPTSRCIGAERKFQNGPAATESRYCAADEAGLQSAVNRTVSELHTCMPSKQIHYQHASTFQ